MNFRTKKSPRGFTLLEILIAMFIMAIVVSIIFTSYTGTFRVIDEAESQAEIYGMARIALQRIQEDLESAYFSQEKKPSQPGDIQPCRFEGKDRDIEGRDADTLRFFSRAHLIFDEGGVDSGTAEVSYYVKEKDGRDDLTLYRSDTPGFKEAPEEGTGGVVLCDGLWSIKFLYYDADGTVHDSWDTKKEEYKGKLPVMVSVFLDFLNMANTEEPYKFMTGVALPMAGNTYGKVY